MARNISCSKFLAYCFHSKKKSILHLFEKNSFQPHKRGIKQRYCGFVDFPLLCARFNMFGFYAPTQSSTSSTPCQRNRSTKGDTSIKKDQLTPLLSKYVNSELNHLNHSSALSSWSLRLNITLPSFGKTMLLKSLFKNWSRQSVLCKSCVFRRLVIKSVEFKKA